VLGKRNGPDATAPSEHVCLCVVEGGQAWIVLLVWGGGVVLMMIPVCGMLRAVQAVRGQTEGVSRVE